ncbi:MAG: AAA family ATPase [Alcanivoracaceae bacterium]|nr:AAA family ATPase [Alcanivoracaceae bacterium]
MYIDGATLKQALNELYGTAGHLLKIWFALKHMGLAVGRAPVEIDTANSEPSLIRLFSCGSPDHSFFVPFAHKPRWTNMKHDAARSIVQTNIQRWASSGSVVTCDPTSYLDFSRSEDGRKLYVKPGRKYPLGLGFGESGFALDQESVVSIPITAFSVWYARQTKIPDSKQPKLYLVENMLKELHISSEEKAVIFVDDDLSIGLKSKPLTDRELFSICKPFADGDQAAVNTPTRIDFKSYVRRVKGMVSGLDNPHWIRSDPREDLRRLIEEGAGAILLYGPPRTSKTWVIDSLVPRDSDERVTIQIHDGWGYDHLIEGLKPEPDGSWVWKDGPLKRAIKEQKKYIVLEEANRTNISQALGEVFSLIEEGYRGDSNEIELRSSELFSISKETVFLLTMNTIDKSTEEVDDALLGRMAGVEFPPRVEDLATILSLKNITPQNRDKIRQVFAEIQSIYPLGHAYFSGLPDEANNADFLFFYKTRIRPVLNNFLGPLRRPDLETIDNLADHLFGDQ